MNIPKISNMNFGRFEGWECEPDVKLSYRDKLTMKNIEEYLNKLEGKVLKIYGKVGYYDSQRPKIRCVKLKTYPTRENMDVLLQYRPDARARDYAAKSYGFPIYSRFLTELIRDFVVGQARYIHYCKCNPNHNVNPIISQRLNVQA